jgi:hypothetical protein
MDTNIEQHHAFLPGMQDFLTYVKECRKENGIEKFDKVKFVQLIDSFGPLLAKHLADEIETLLDLEKYDIKAIKEAYIGFDLKMREGDKVYLSYRRMKTWLTPVGNIVPSGSWKQ